MARDVEWCGHTPALAWHWASLLAIMRWRLRTWDLGLSHREWRAGVDACRHVTQHTSSESAMKESSDSMSSSA